jgi:succinoglycan biosynthesis protein ExoM
LRECLDSLLGQEISPGISLVLVVVENDHHAHMREIVEATARERASISVIYAHEPRIGIPLARNCALAHALEHNPDWIGFIDDDEVAAPDWLMSFVHAAKSVPCDVFQGPVEYRYATPTPDWLPLPARKFQPTGLPLRTAATSNTFMRARIARPDGLGLRFNENMRFSGGSDNEYFYRAADLGARICWMNDAVVFESVPESRTTLEWRRARSLRVAANSVFIQQGRLGLLAAIAICVPKYAGRILLGAILAPVAAALSLVAAKSGRRMLASALCDVSSGLGGLGAFFAFQPDAYRTVDNH